MLHYFLTNRITILFTSNFATPILATSHSIYNIVSMAFACLYKFLPSNPRSTLVHIETLGQDGPSSPHHRERNPRLNKTSFTFPYIKRRTIDHHS